ncbi:MAG TPA: universal stress protein [Solirubrobacteraceae bacterium]|nr:universal stress protein [Solirubrobacteraceae bacterium]
MVENTDTMSAPIVVGVDGSERSHDAVVLAARLAESGQDLLLVHVHAYGRLSNLLSGGEQEQLVRDVAESTAMVVLGTLEPSTRRSMRLVSNRSPAAGLQAMAAEVGAPLIVVGSSHRAGLGRVMPGSVAESVLTEAPAAVAVAPKGYARSEGSLRSIGCGFDDSPESHEALGWAASFARRRDARLVAFAIHTPLAFGGLSTTGATGYQSANEVLRDQLGRRTLRAVSSLGSAVQIGHRLLDGDPAVELARASAGLDVLVVGSRGYGAVRTVLLGSVARELVRTSACPVVVVPRGGAQVRGSDRAAEA